MQKYEANELTMLLDATPGRTVEERILWAVLEQALFDALDQRRGLDQRIEANAWIATCGTAEELGTFSWCCSLLGLDENRHRRRLLIFIERAKEAHPERRHWTRVDVRRFLEVRS